MLTCSRAGPVLFLAQPTTAASLSSSSLDRRTDAWSPRARRRCATSCFAVSRSPSTQPRTWRRLEALSPLPHSLHSLPLLCPFSSSRPRATELAAAARLTTVPPSPSHCAKKLRRFVLDVPTEPRVARSPNALTAAVIFNLQSPRSPAPVRHLRRLPRAAEKLNDLHVSPALFPPTPVLNFELWPSFSWKPRSTAARAQRR